MNEWPNYSIHQFIYLYIGLLSNMWILKTTQYLEYNWWLHNTLDIIELHTLDVVLLVFLLTVGCSGRMRCRRLGHRGARPPEPAGWSRARWFRSAKRGTGPRRRYHRDPRSPQLGRNPPFQFLYRANMLTDCRNYTLTSEQHLLYTARVFFGFSGDWTLNIDHVQ